MVRRSSKTHGSVWQEDFVEKKDIDKGGETIMDVKNEFPKRIQQISTLFVYAKGKKKRFDDR